MKKARHQLTPEFNIINFRFESMFIKKIQNHLHTKTLFEDFSIIILREISFSKSEVYFVNSITSNTHYLNNLENNRLHSLRDYLVEDEIYIIKNNHKHRQNRNIDKFTNSMSTCAIFSIKINKEVSAIISLIGEDTNLTKVNIFNSQQKLKTISLNLTYSILSYINKNKKNQFNNENLHVTAVEIDILRYSADGFTAKEIAHKIFLSKSGVDFHFVNLKRKLKCRNKTQTIAKAIFLRLI
ncbi:DNA-binding transcriptional activator SdiA [Yersinia massiliensis]|uniref:response regulator transcription factor n=1 Tax=Yersinia massiliensis TaxID=419257 RepID=UPI0005DC7378|nr:LuxR C-terminal-related transcriptional regulator [Yersinia massiliensis]CNI41562.1 DNA-binding transcriptional activator SdiA [Yersinia massiliensis]